MNLLLRECSNINEETLNSSPVCPLNDYEKVALRVSESASLTSILRWIKGYSGLQNYKEDEFETLLG